MLSRDFLKLPKSFPIAYLVRVLQSRILVVAFHFSLSLLMFKLYLHYHVHNLIAATFQETYIAKVEHVKRIKEKQDEDKAAVTLHSFKLVE